uniref:Uncharacterized protein n=1 Tax=Triticum urartu TaxID=4572 RepID=A0A8R7QIM4_TRIUA
MSSRVGNGGLEPVNLRETSETGGGREGIGGRKFWEEQISDSGICEGMSWQEPGGSAEWINSNSRRGGKIRRWRCIWMAATPLWTMPVAGIVSRA